MNAFSNIWNHPKTSAAGILIAVVTVAGVLSQQGISLGKAGSGSVVSLVTALATAILGLLAKDPDGSQPSTGQTTQAQRMASHCSAAALAVDRGLHLRRRRAGHRQLDAFTAKRSSHRGLDSSIACARRCARLYRSHGKL